MGIQHFECPPASTTSKVLDARPMTPLKIGKTKNRISYSHPYKIMLFLHIVRVIYLPKYISFYWRHLNNYTLFENKCFNPRNQNHCMAFITHVNNICVQTQQETGCGLHTPIENEIICSYTTSLLYTIHPLSSKAKKNKLFDCPLITFQRVGRSVGIFFFLLSNVEC